jgi:hypothetical protein
MSAKPKVLFILGCTRSGTTILNRILGQLDGFFAAGEIQDIWQRSLLGGRFCGCGQRFRDCQVWKAIFDDAFGGFDGVDAESLKRAVQSATRTRGIPRMMLPGRRRFMLRRVKQLVEPLEELYCSVQKVTGHSVIVDSSKQPLYGYLLSLMKGLELYVLHLVRDPRAVAYSWQRVKKQPDGGMQNETMRQFNSPFVASMWNAWNLAGESLLKHGRYLRIRYEDFVESPRTNLHKIIEFTGTVVRSTPFEDEKVIHLNPNHTCSGNPNRFDTGRVELRIDDQWQQHLKRRDKLLVTCMTWPLMRHYSYA